MPELNDIPNVGDLAVAHGYNDARTVLHDQNDTLLGPLPGRREPLQLLVLGTARPPEKASNSARSA